VPVLGMSGDGMPLARETASTTSAALFCQRRYNVALLARASEATMSMVSRS
jgi:hypothetical protein